MWILGLGWYNRVNLSHTSAHYTKPEHTIAIECNVARNMSHLTWLPNPYDEWFLKPAV